MEMGIGLRIGDGAESRARRQGRPDDVGGCLGGGPARIEQFRALVPGAFDEDRRDAEGASEGRGIGDVEAEQGAAGSLAEGQPLEIGLHGDPQGTARPDVVEEIEALRTAGETVSGHVRRGQARDGRLQRGIGEGQGADGLGLRPVDTALHGTESLADGGVAGADRGQFDADTAEQGLDPVGGGPHGTGESVQGMVGRDAQGGEIGADIGEIDDAGRVARTLPGLVGQGADLGGNDGETAPMLTGSRCLDRRVQRQHPDRRADPIDGGDDPARLGGLGVDARADAGDLGVDRAHGLPDRIHELAAEALGRPRRRVAPRRCRASPPRNGRRLSIGDGSRG